MQQLNLFLHQRPASGPTRSLKTSAFCSAPRAIKATRSQLWPAAPGLVGSLLSGVYFVAIAWGGHVRSAVRKFQVAAKQLAWRCLAPYEPSSQLSRPSSGETCAWLEETTGKSGCTVPRRQGTPFPRPGPRAQNGGGRGTKPGGDKARGPVSARRPRPLRACCAGAAGALGARAGRPAGAVSSEAAGVLTCAKLKCRRGVTQ